MYLTFVFDRIIEIERMVKDTVSYFIIYSLGVIILCTIF